MCPNGDGECTPVCARGKWNLQQQRQHINYLELFVIAFVLWLFQNGVIAVMTVNTSVMDYLNKHGGGHDFPETFHSSLRYLDLVQDSQSFCGCGTHAWGGQHSGG